MSPPVSPLPVDALLHFLEIVPAKLLGPQEDLVSETLPLSVGGRWRPVLLPLVTLFAGVATTATAALFGERGDHNVEPEVLEVLESFILLTLFLFDSDATMVNVRVF